MVWWPSEGSRNDAVLQKQVVYWSVAWSSSVLTDFERLFGNLQIRCGLLSSSPMLLHRIRLPAAAYWVGKDPGWLATGIGSRESKGGRQKLLMRMIYQRQKYGGRRCDFFGSNNYFFWNFLKVIFWQKVLKLIGWYMLGCLFVVDSCWSHFDYSSLVQRCVAAYASLSTQSTHAFASS